MSGIVILGTQWGDEGKGKVVDVVSSKADMVVRFQGGNNAGHTLVIENEKFVFHLLPSGVLYDNAKCVIASGVVIDLKVLLHEMELMNSRGRKTDHILISSQAHLIMPYHVILDKMIEATANKIGTTQRGIGPTYADKINRVGIRVADLIDFDNFKIKVQKNVEEKNLLLTKIYNTDPLDANAIIDEFAGYREKIQHMVIDSSETINEYLENNKQVVFEGAQGSMLDIDFGNYPYVTSSSPSIGGVLTGTGIPYKYLTQIIGIVKAYSTRVGEGPFVTEQINDVGEKLREAGNEFGATTGRPRRCGFLDLNVVRKSIQINNLTELALTKLDVLGCLNEIPVCIAYEHEGKQTNKIPANVNDFAKLKPIYKMFKGWNTDISGIRNFADLPQEAQDYVLFIETFLKCKVSLVSVGPKRDQNIYR